MTKDDFIREFLLRTATITELGKYPVGQMYLKANELADMLYPTDPEGLHQTICKILRFADFRKFASSVTSIEEQYEHLHDILLKDISEQDLQTLSHCRK